MRAKGIVLTALLALAACQAPAPTTLGRFDVEKDLFLAHFDSKTDVDDLHSIAGVATMLADLRFADVQFHAVAGAYGIQDGLYVPANELFEIAFGEHWSDAHANREQALAEVLPLVAEALERGGDIWIAEAGQSDFSAALVRRLDEGDRARVHVVQHSDWNQDVTTPEDLAYLRNAASYHRIPDGNAVGNGTPGFRSEEVVPWREHVTDARLAEAWEVAVEIGNRYNGVEGRYLNEAIAAGGLDFSDVSETCWIFGFEDLEDADAFFAEFGS